MSFQEYILAGGELPIHMHSQWRLRRLESQQPGVHILVFRFNGSEAISDILRHEIIFTRHSLTGDPISNIPYRITMPDGKIIEGITSATGETELSQSEIVDDMILSVFPKGK